MYVGFELLYIRTYMLLFYKPMCVFCVRIRLFKRLCAIYAALHMLCGFCVRNTPLTRKANFAYVYDLCALSGLCVRIRLCV